MAPPVRPEEPVHHRRVQAADTSRPSAFRTKPTISSSSGVRRHLFLLSQAPAAIVVLDV